MLWLRMDPRTTTVVLVTSCGSIGIVSPPTSILVAILQLFLVSRGRHFALRGRRHEL